MEGNTMLTLPIDVIPGSNPPRFRWNYMHGNTPIAQEGVLPPSVERAVETLIGIAKQALMENAMLNGTVESLNERLIQAQEQPKPAEQVKPVAVRKGK